MLDADPDAVLCYSTVVDIDEHGKPITIHDRNNATAEYPNERFLKLIDLEHLCEETYGMIRSEVLRKTRLQQNYTDSDRTLLSELSLYGKFLQVPEPLFYRRVHPQRSTVVFSNWRDRMNWFGEEMKDRIVLPHWMQFFDYLVTIARSHISLKEQLLCYRHMLTWLFVFGHGRWMAKDILLAALKYAHRLKARIAPRTTKSQIQNT
jgi:hypothetical protein